MTPDLTPLKKAAILLASLDDETADGLLAQMEPAQIVRVRREISELGPIDPAIQQQVVAEFRRQEQAPHDPYPAGIELDSGLAERLAHAEVPLLYGPPAPAVEEPPPFRFLHQAEADALVGYLKDERPQTIALVVSHLSPEQAAEVIDRLDPALQAQVLRRLAELDETDPGVLREVERHLESWISQQLRSRQRKQAGLQSLTAILSAANGPMRRQIATNLAQHDSSLAQTLGLEVPRSTSSTSPTDIAADHRLTDAARSGRATQRFAELTKLNDTQLSSVLKQADSEVLVLALAGASASFVERATTCLPARQARLLRRALKHLGPTRLSDVQEAQQALADLANEVQFYRSVPIAHKRAVVLAT